MIARVHSSILQGIDAIACEVEADVVGSSDHPEIKLVGLAEAAVRESVSRTQAALHNSGYRWPGPKVTINLAPADVKKDSSGYDLPIAIACMIASGQFQSDKAEDYLMLGELALDGRVRRVRGALASAMLAASQGKRGIIVPAENAAEAAVVEGIEVIPVSSLGQAVSFLSGQLAIEPAPSRLGEFFSEFSSYEDDFADVRGQEMAKRIPTILPPLLPEESLETTRVYSSRGLLEPGQPLMALRPVRTPHHSSSAAALIGGGAIPQPGEVSLAHHGVLFLDEFPEFARATLEMIRQPLEDGYVTIPRVHSTLKFPARIMLVAAMNPCPCGYYTDPKRKCSCSPNHIERYLSRISGPLIDRIDIHIEVPPVPWKQLRSADDGTSSADMRKQVVAAREIQRRRFTQAARLFTNTNANAGSPGKGQESAAAGAGTGNSGANGTITTNATMTSRQVRKFCRLDAAGETILKQAMTELGLSARAHDKVLRIARTIADLEGAADIAAHHLAEAIQYRRLDRKL